MNQENLRPVSVTVEDQIAKSRIFCHDAFTAWFKCLGIPPNAFKKFSLYKEVQMRLFKTVFMASILFMAFSSAAEAGDFDWMKDFNIRGEVDPTGFRARLAARFQVGDVQIKTVLNNVEKPADAYMVLRLAEMSDRPTSYVVKQYRAHRGKGWGVLARTLGIKPGSREFHALKRRQDLYEDRHRGKGKGKGKGKSKGKGRK